MEEEKGIVDMMKEQGLEPTAAPPLHAPVTRAATPTPESMVTDNDNINSVLNSLLENVTEKGGWVSIKLPSLGKCYPNYNNDSVNIRPFTFEDERNLRVAARDNEGNDAITELLNNCVDGIPVQALTIFDKNYVLFKLRELSYGSSYPIVGKCDTCGTNNTLRLELSSLPVSYFEEDYEEYSKVFLPDSKKTAVIRFPRVNDEPHLDTPEKLVDGINRFVTSVEGVTDEAIIFAFVRKTTVKDVTTLRNKIFDLSLGFESEIIYPCGGCQRDNKTALTLNENFFSVS